MGVFWNTESIWQCQVHGHRRPSDGHGKAIHICPLDKHDEDCRWRSLEGLSSFRNDPKGISGGGLGAGHWAVDGGLRCHAGRPALHYRPSGRVVFSRGPPGAAVPSAMPRMPSCRRMTRKSRQESPRSDSFQQGDPRYVPPRVEAIERWHPSPSSKMRRKGRDVEHIPAQKRVAIRCPPVLAVRAALARSRLSSRPADLCHRAHPALARIAGMPGRQHRRRHRRMRAP